MPRDEAVNAGDAARANLTTIRANQEGPASQTARMLQATTGRPAKFARPPNMVYNSKSEPKRFLHNNPCLVDSIAGYY
jgi:hypothetical protein